MPARRNAFKRNLRSSTTPHPNLAPELGTTLREKVLPAILVQPTFPDWDRDLCTLPLPRNIGGLGIRKPQVQTGDYPCLEKISKHFDETDMTRSMAKQKETSSQIKYITSPERPDSTPYLRLINPKIL